MASTPKPISPRSGPKKAPRPIGKTATGNPTATPDKKDRVDEAAEESFPASDPPAGAVAGTASAPPAEDISPARYIDPQETKRKPR